ncbi:MAG: ATP-binding cassette domain-containing protein, partial [Lysobacterales bacterium]
MKKHDKPLMTATDQASNQGAGHPAPWLNPDARPMVEIRGLTKRFGDTVAVDRADLDIYKGELFSILGASGSGKSTLLRLLAGFEAPSEGSILIDGADMSAVPPYER